MSQAEAHACVVDGIGVAIGNGAFAIRYHSQALGYLDCQRQRCLAANGQANHRGVDALDDADVRDPRNITPRGIGEYRKELEEPAGFAGATLDDLCEQVGSDNNSVVGGTCGPGCWNDRKWRTPQTPLSEVKSRTHAFESICCANVESVGVSFAGRGDSALGKFEVAQLHGGVGLRHVRHAHRYFRGAIKRTGIVVSLVFADQCGVERRGWPGSNHDCGGCGCNGRRDDRMLGVCKKGNRVNPFRRSAGSASLSARTVFVLNQKRQEVAAFQSPECGDSCRILEYADWSAL